MGLKNRKRTEEEFEDITALDEADSSLEDAENGEGQETRGETKGRRGRKKGQPSATPYQWNREKDAALFGALRANPGQQTPAAVAEALAKHPAFAGDSTPVSGLNVAGRVKLYVKGLEKEGEAIPEWLTLAKGRNTLNLDLVAAA